MASRKTSNVWQHFSEIKDQRVICLYCGKELSVSNKSTFNLIRHLNAKHPTESQEPRQAPPTIEDTNSSQNTNRHSGRTVDHAVVDPFEMCDTTAFEFQESSFFTDFNESIGISAGNSNVFAPTVINLKETTLDDVKQTFLMRMERMEQNMTFMFKRLFTEVITLRKENAILKTKVEHSLTKNPPQISKPKPATEPAVINTVSSAYPFVRLYDDDTEEEQLKYEVDKATGSECSENTSSDSPKKKKAKTETLLKCNAENRVIPLNPFERIDDFLDFEKSIKENADRQERLVNEMVAMHNLKADSYIRNCWRLLLTDNVGQGLCWRGTDVKTCVKDLSCTTALQTAFERKFKDSAGEFVRVTQLHFHYAKDRLVKNLRNKIKRSKT